MTEDLKPCPFCGGKAVLQHPGTRMGRPSACMVGCIKCRAECRASGLQTHSEPSAVAAWNRRHDDLEYVGDRYIVTSGYLYQSFASKWERSEWVETHCVKDPEYRTVRRYKVKR